MALPAPPYRSAFAVPENVIGQAGKLPKLVIGFEWQQFFGNITEAVDANPARRSKVNVSAEDASIGTSPIPMGSVAPGIWRVSYVARIVVPGTISSSLTVSFGWTVGGVAQNQSGAVMNGNTTTTVQFGTLILRVDANTPITYSTTYASAGATPMEYSLDIVAEELALD